MTRRKQTEEIPSGDCRNCGEFTDTPFCANCGQKNRIYKLSLRDILSEAIEELLDVDSRLFRTLRALYLKPGLLTAEYLAGKRIKYISPVRLYLVASVIFFLLLSVKTFIPEIQSSEFLQNWKESGDLETAIETTMDSSMVTQAPDTIQVSDDTVTIQLDSQSLGRELDAKDFWGLFQENLAKIMFLLLPVAALLLKLLYLRRGRVYLEHLIFAIHLHAFIFTFLILTVFISAQFIWWIVLISSIVYLYLAMRRVYGQSIFKTGTKVVLLFFSYGLTTIVAITIAMMLAAVIMFIGQGG